MTATGLTAGAQVAGSKPGRLPVTHQNCIAEILRLDGFDLRRNVETAIDTIRELPTAVQRKLA